MKQRWGRITAGVLCGLLLAVLAFTAGRLTPAKADVIAVGRKAVYFSSAADAPVSGFFHLGTGRLYDKTNNALADAPTWTDCVTAAAADTAGKLWKDEPETTLPPGEYLWRQWDTAADAAAGSVPDRTKALYWTGTTISRMWDE
jgi:hypothetical protein